MSNRVSVVIPVFNSCKTIDETLKSVLNQDYHDIEIIVVNDGSTDDILSVLNKYDGLIKVINTKNNGVSCARNVGIRNSTGNYIAFLDSDDIWESQKISKQMQLMLNNIKCGVCYTDRYLIDANSSIILSKNRKHYDGYVLNKILVTNFICLSSALVKKECFDVCGYFDENLFVSEDYDLWIRISSKYCFLFVDEKLVYYRITPGSLTKNRTRMFVNAFNVFIKNTCNDDISVDIKLITFLKFYSDTYKSLGLYAYELSKYNLSLKYFLLSILLYPLFLESYVMAIKSTIKRVINR